MFLKRTRSFKIYNRFLRIYSILKIYIRSFQEWGVTTIRETMKNRRGYQRNFDIFNVTNSGLSVDISLQRF